MRKLNLNVQELSVESFETSRMAPEKGTVFGHATDAAGTCAGHYTCDGTCDQTCGVVASCELYNSYCGTYVEVGCPNSYWMCTVGTDANGPCS
jgi:hypothetical protein